MTIKLGSLVLTRIQPLMKPMASETTRARATPDPDIQREVPANMRGRQRRGDHGNAGGKVELAADHQQRHPHRHNADRGGLPYRMVANAVRLGKSGRNESRRKRTGRWRPRGRPPRAGPAASGTGCGGRSAHRAPAMLAWSNVCVMGNSLVHPCCRAGAEPARASGACLADALLGELAERRRRWYLSTMAGPVRTGWPPPTLKPPRLVCHRASTDR